jgi:MFS family permease
VAAIAYGVQGVGTLLLCVVDSSQLTWIVLAIALFGSGIGNATSLPPLIAQVEFVPDDVPRVVSLIVAVGQAGYAFAPAAFGLVREFAPSAGADAGAAPWVFAVAALGQLLAIAAFLAGRRR